MNKPASELIALDKAGLDAAARECARITAPEITDEEYEKIVAEDSLRYRNTRLDMERTILAYLSAAGSERAGVDAEAPPAELGTFACPICGKDEPHYHPPKDRANIVAAAWVCELAQVVSQTRDGNTWSNWKESLTLHRPIVPAGSIRNLRALYVAPPSLATADEIYKAMIARIAELMDADVDTPDGRELVKLAAACEAYEEETERLATPPAQPAPVSDGAIYAAVSAASMSPDDRSAIDDHINKKLAPLIEFDPYGEAEQWGMKYALEVFGKQIAGVEDWEGGDGSETVDGDLLAEFDHIARAAGWVNADGDPVFGPSEPPSTHGKPDGAVWEQPGVETIAALMYEAANPTMKWSYLWPPYNHLHAAVRQRYLDAAARFEDAYASMEICATCGVRWIDGTPCESGRLDCRITRAVALSPKIPAAETKNSEKCTNPGAKATEGKAGMAGVTGPVRRSTTGTGLRVGEASADLPTTSEIMDVTAGETAPLPSEAHSNHGKPDGAVRQLDPWQSELDEMIGHLGAAIHQSVASDDQIIMDHVKAAHEIAKIVRRKA